MLDCSINQEEKELFITSFEIKEDSILVNYANGKTEIVKKTLKNNKKLITKMRSQISDLKYVMETKKSIFLDYVLMLVCLCMMFLAFPAFIGFGLGGKIISLVLALVDSFAIYKVGKQAISKFREYSSVDDEFEKFQTYLNNQELLEEHNISANIINEINISEQDVKNRSLDGNININVVDKMSLKDLEVLLLYMRKFQISSIERFEPEETERGQQKTIGLMPGSEIEK